MATTKTSKSQKSKSGSNKPCVLKPDHDLTVEQTDQFLDKAGKALKGKSPEAVVDLEQVKQIDGPGLASLLMLQQSINEKEGSLTILTENSDWKALFEATGVDEFLTVQESL